MKKKKYALHFLVITQICILIVLTIGCTVRSVNPPGIITATSADQSSLTVSPTEKVTQSASATSGVPFRKPTSTETPTATFTSTDTALPTASKTLMPTLNESEREKAIMQLLRKDPLCKLPCFAGFMPGKSSWNDIKTKFLEMGFDWSKAYNPTLGDGKVYYTSMGSIFDPFTFAFSPNVDNETLDGILVGIYSPRILTTIPDYYFSNLIQTMGTPSRVWMSTSYREGLPLPNFDFWIFYDKQGVVLKYLSYALADQNSLKVCPKQPNRFLSGSATTFYGENIYLQNPENPRKLEELVQIWGEKIPDLPNSLERQSGFSIEEAAGLTPEDFYQMIVDTDVQCFTTPKELWLKK